jgi:uncharacterized protein (DUF1697 family)
MKKYIALLRGINVSGQKKIKMTELKSLFEKLNFQNVETYIQSGNIIFSSKENSVKTLERKINAGIKNKFGFEVHTFVITSKEIRDVLINNPFVKKNKDTERLYVTFLSEQPLKEKIQNLNSSDFSPEEYQIVGNIIYLHLPNGAGKAKLNNNFFENKLKVNSTTRNWKTINTLSELTDSQ